MEKSSIQKLINNLEKHIEKFENEKIQEKKRSQNLGVIYTPSHVVDYLVTNIFRIYLNTKCIFLKKVLVIKQWKHYFQ